MKRSPRYRRGHVPGARARRTALRGAAACAGLAALTACGTAASPPPPAPAVSATAAGPRGTAQVGDIAVSGAYIPQPASPDVAVVYLTVRNNGSVADTLVSATTVPASQPMLMRESDSGGSAETMTDLPGGVPVPAHGSTTLAPDGLHLMLNSPAARLVAGDHVTVTLHLAHAGDVPVDVPVTSLLTDAGTGSMPAMAGM